jgi:hypothetical protein
VVVNEAWNLEAGIGVSPVATLQWVSSFAAWPNLRNYTKYLLSHELFETIITTALAIPLTSQAYLSERSMAMAADRPT